MTAKVSSERRENMAGAQAGPGQGSHSLRDAFCFIGSAQEKIAAILTPPHTNASCLLA
jgi:hypothetical protein